MKIKKPVSIQNLTLERRLTTYDWDTHFEFFQRTTHAGGFTPICWQQGESLLPVSITGQSYLNICHLTPGVQIFA